MPVKFASLVALLSATPFAAPAPQAGPGVIPTPQAGAFCPIIEATNTVDGKQWQTGNAVGGGWTIGLTQSHTVGTSWTVGGDLGLSFDKVLKALGVSAGISASVTQLKSDTTGESASVECPEGPWTCSMVIHPGMKKVNGHLASWTKGKVECDKNIVNSYDDLDGKKFEMISPMSDDAHVGSFRPELCVCKNRDGADAKGHPALACPDDCP
ncbi:hypothetical protein F4778DRAFT_763414 [Xylariomycetidae sp. FL2044]|nr:hypothetical protein F4778DRAFT_767328 [Xylariomycetidae sp. FL2044]KAH9884377.1 hypothetical protein F4778DRAFT_763414 [Xylariomycetidae sp. FL2044]